MASPNVRVPNTPSEQIMRPSVFMDESAEAISSRELA